MKTNPEDPSRLVTERASPEVTRPAVVYGPVQEVISENWANRALPPSIPKAKDPDSAAGLWRLEAPKPKAKPKTPIPAAPPVATGPQMWRRPEIGHVATPRKPIIRLSRLQWDEFFPALATIAVSDHRRVYNILLNSKLS
jgi:hypothetical protein